VLLLPGWPQTWWEFHKIMPELAKRHRVIAVDLRGMGGSAKPGLGYDKKNMAKDIHELTQALGYKQVNIAGHDIGAMVAYSFAANYPDATLKICLIDVAHPEESLYTLSLLPPPGHAVRGTGESTYPVYLWWFAFNQLPDLPQQLLAGKSRLLIDWLFDSQLRNPAAISERDRAIYAAAYSQPDAIRAGNGWYQTFGQDIIDAKHYGQIATPVLALAGERNYPYLRELLPTQASDVRVVKVNSSSHYVPEDQPEAVVRELLGFFNSVSYQSSEKTPPCGVFSQSFMNATRVSASLKVKSGRVAAYDVDLQNEAAGYLSIVTKRLFKGLIFTTSNR
jgi:pimeloyl-ACP methyl ester carboxylesterase